MFDWYRSGKRLGGRYTPHLGFTTGFRNAAYDRDAADPDAVVYALKSFQAVGLRGSEAGV